jgi:hypothetical protein
MTTRKRRASEDGALRPCSQDRTVAIRTPRNVANRVWLKLSELRIAQIWDGERRGGRALIVEVRTVAAFSSGTPASTAAQSAWSPSTISRNGWESSLARGRVDFFAFVPDARLFAGVFCLLIGSPLCESGFQTALARQRSHDIPPSRDCLSRSWLRSAKARSVQDRGSARSPRDTSHSCHGRTSGRRSGSCEVLPVGESLDADPDRPESQARAREDLHHQAPMPCSAARTARR